MGIIVFMAIKRYYHSNRLGNRYLQVKVSSLLRFSWGGIPLLLPTRRFGSVFGSLGAQGLLLKQRLPAASLRDSSSSKDNLIETRTKIIVGAMP